MTDLTDIVLGEDVLGTTRDESTGIVLAQLGDVVNELATGQDVEVWQDWGFCSRPAEAEAGKDAAQGVVVKGTFREAIIAGRDHRSTELYGALEPGETAVFASTGQARAMFKADGSISLVTTSDNTEAGSTIIFTISPENGLQFASKWGGFSLGPDGFKVYTQNDSNVSKFCLSAGRDDGVCQVIAATSCKLAAASVLLGPSATAANGVAYSVAGPANVISTCVFVST